MLAGGVLISCGSQLDKKGSIQKIPSLPITVTGVLPQDETNLIIQLEFSVVYIVTILRDRAADGSMKSS